MDAAAAALAATSPSYQELRRRVDECGTRIVFVLGLPRGGERRGNRTTPSRGALFARSFERVMMLFCAPCGAAVFLNMPSLSTFEPDRPRAGGTTALERFLYERLPFDAQVNEPSLLGPPTGEGRAEATFRRVLAAADEGATILVKEVTNKVLPAMTQLWARVARWCVVVVRSPALQLESRLKCMVDRADSGALAAFGVDADARADSVEIHGARVLEGDANGASWRVAWRAAKRDRDLSARGCATINPRASLGRGDDAAAALVGRGDMPRPRWVAAICGGRAGSRR